MATKRQTRTQRVIKAIVAFGLSGLVKLSMILIMGVAGVSTYLGALYTAHHLGWTGLGANAFALLPDALMVLSAARMRQSRLSDYQRKTAQRAMRFGLGFSLVTNGLAAFLQAAPNGSWVDYSSSRAVWMQHLIFVLMIIWHAAPVLVLWYSTEMLTRGRTEALRATKAGEQRSSVLGLGFRKILAQRPSQA